MSLPVHIHSSLGVPPFLRSLESDVSLRGVSRALSSFQNDYEK